MKNNTTTIPDMALDVVKLPFKPSFADCTDDGVVFLKDGECPNLGAMFQDLDFVVAIELSLNMGMPIVQFTAHNPLSLGSHVVIVCPNQLALNYKKTFKQMFGEECKVVDSVAKWTGVNGKLTVISDRIFSRIEFSREDFHNSVVIQDYYPSRWAPTTKTQQDIINKLHQFSKSAVIIDSNPLLLKSFKAFSKLTANDDVKSKYIAYIKHTFKMEGK